MQNAIESYEKVITIDGRQARYYDFQELPTDDNSHSSDKPILHFYGGNGFPVGAYEPLITELSQYFHVISLAMRGYWFDEPNDKVLTRQQDAEVLIEFLDQTQESPIIGIGHSQGATATAIAAAKRPDLFSALFLFDPVTFTQNQVTLYEHIPRFIMMRQEPFKSTLNKQQDWDSATAYYKHLRKLPAFRRISDSYLKTFAKNSLIMKDTNDATQGYTLLFKPEFELASYFGTPYINEALKTLSHLPTKQRLPYTIVLGKPSVFNSVKVRKSWHNIVPRDNIVTLPAYGHLLPFEAPKTCTEIVVCRTFKDACIFNS